jgi:hypothetical protein
MAMVMVTSSAMLLMCLYGFDLISMWVVVCDDGFTTVAPNTRFPLIWGPSMYMNVVDNHLAMNASI